MSNRAVAVLMLWLLACVTSWHLVPVMRWRLWILCGLTGVMVIWFALGVLMLRWQFFVPVIWRGPTKRRAVALTYDDGPDSVTTPVLLATLRELGVPATFFCVGRRVRLHPELLQQMVADGHEVANHTWSHPWWWAFSFGKLMLRQVNRTDRAIHQAIGLPVTWFRPPVGLTNPHLIGALRHAGLVCVGWSVRSYDRLGSVESVVGRVVSQAHPGAIVMLHDADQSPERIERICREMVCRLREQGYEFVTVSQLLSSVK